MPRVHVNPVFRGADRADGGIRRVTEALDRYLPEFGYEVSVDPESADITMNHGAQLCERPGVPMISCNHGQYWLGYPWPLWSEDANRRVLESLIRADAITVPSKWVAPSVQRGLLRNPTVIYHGIDTDAWSPPEKPQSFILWNKARKDPVSDPADMQKLAGMVPHLPFVTTIGNGDEPANVRVIGVRPVDKMKEVVRHAWVYLATTRETFGIGTLEALACGVPVVGWDYGGQSEIILPNKSGILVPYGDFGALSEALQEVWTNRSRFSVEAREDAIKRWQWPDKIRQYADLMTRVLAVRSELRHSPKVSIVVTSYNLAEYLPWALKSVQEMTYRNWECIIVDDSSTDNTEAIGREWESKGNFTYLRTPTNRGLSGARNFGAAHARGEYLIFLDADDALDVSGLSDLVDALENDAGLHIAFGALDTMREDGSGRSRNGWPKGPFDWRGQAAHLNQLPYASLMRRSTFAAVGGYRVRDWRAEDAAFWLRATSHGFRAERVTERPVLIYRNRSNSKSGRERDQYADQDGDWTAWFPWRVGASSGEEGALVVKSSLQPHSLVVPYGAPGKPPAPHIAWPVRHFAEPLVSVIIPVGPGHEPFLIDALDSLVAQSFPEWEVIVVNDTPGEVSTAGHPYARVLKTDVPGSGPGRARNLGINEARGELIVFLDADDWLRPDALEKMVERYGLEGGYIYSDCVALQNGPADKVYTQRAGRDWSAFTDDFSESAVHLIESTPYNRADFLKRGYTPNAPGAHSVSILAAKVDLLEIGGFNETLPFWEDWEIMLRLAVKGVCGRRIAEPLLSYRFSTGKRRQASKDVVDQIEKTLAAEFGHLAAGVDDMCGCGGGGSNLQQKSLAAVSPIKGAGSQRMDPAEDIRVPGRDASRGFKEAQKVRLRYIGRKSAPVPYIGKGTGTVYRVARDSINEVIDVDPSDAEFFLSLKDFIQVEGSEVSPEVVQW